MTAEGFRFERLGRAHEKEMLEYAGEFRAEGEELFGEILDDTEAYFESARRFENDVDLPKDRVPMTHYLLFENSLLVATSRLRRRLIPVLLLDGGHIGYEVRPSARGRGLATEILLRTLDEARAIEVDRALLTAEESNAGSIRVIEKAGGTRDSDSVSPRTGEHMRRFWIDL